MNRKYVKLALSVFFAGISIILLSKIFSIGTVYENMRKIRISPIYFLIFFLFLLSNIYVRGAILSRIFYEHSRPFTYWASIASIHNVCTSVLPYGLGEGILLLYLSQAKMQFKGILGRILVIRIVEVPFLILCFSYGMIFSKTVFQQPVIPITCLVIFTILVLLVLHKTSFIAEVMVALCNKLRLAKVSDVVRSVSAELCSLREKTTLKYLYFSTFLKILSVCLYVLFCLRSLGSDMLFSDSTFFVGSFGLVSMLPVQGVGGIGTFEAYFVGILLALGIQADTSLPLAAAVHVIFYASFFFLATIGFFFLRVASSRKS